MLQEMPLFEEIMPEYASLKQTYLYDFWSRPTLDWSLACERGNSTRLQVQKLMLHSAETEDYSYLSHTSAFFNTAAGITILSDIIVCFGHCITFKVCGTPCFVLPMLLFAIG